MAVVVAPPVKQSLVTRKTGSIPAICEALGRRLMLSAADYFGIHVVDAADGRPVPQVDLVMTDGTRYTTDNGGYIAFNRAGYLNSSQRFVLEAYGYTRAGAAGGNTFNLTPVLNTMATVSLNRTDIAQRLYRETGNNLYDDTLKLGLTAPIAKPLTNAGVYGQDTVQTAVYKGKIYWFWGDTGFDWDNNGQQDGANYRTTGATSILPAQGAISPDAGIDYTYFTGSDGRPKAMFPSSKFTINSLYWLGTPMVVKNAAGVDKLTVSYVAINGASQILERGIAVFNDSTNDFDKATVFPIDSAIELGGYSTRATFGNTDYYLIALGNSVVRVKATYEAVTNYASYETYTPLKAGTVWSTTNGFGGNTLVATDIAKDANNNVSWDWRPGVKPLSGLVNNDLAGRGLVPWAQNPFSFANVTSTSSHIAFSTSAIAYNEYRRQWTFIGEQLFGDSILGETWYAEAPTPVGPWTYTRKVATNARGNDGYTFYNLWQHPYFSLDGKSLYFEGTYTNFLLSSGWQQEVFASNDLTNYVFKQNDDTISDTWAGVPDSRVGADNFSIRWTGRVTFPNATGSYPIRVTADAGVRVTVGSTVVINQWNATTAGVYTGNITVSANSTQTVKVEYRNLTGAANIKLEWATPAAPTTFVVVPSSSVSHDPPQPNDNYNQVMYRIDLTDSRLSGINPGTGLTSQIFNNLDFSSLAATRTGQPINANWGFNAPVAGMDPTDFSVRYTGMIEPKFSETYTFTTVADDGVRLWVDGKLVIDNWLNHKLSTATGVIALQAGRRYDIRVDYYNNTRTAQVQLKWQSASQAAQVVPATSLYASPTGLAATYFDNLDLTLPKLKRTDGLVSINLPNGNLGTPDISGIAPDGKWSTRWSAQLRPDFSGVYTLRTQTDDGVRVFLDGQLVINNWTNHSTTTNTAAVLLEAGKLHDVTVEYYNDLFAAVATLEWSNPSQTAGAFQLVGNANLLATVPLTGGARNPNVRLPPVEDPLIFPTAPGEIAEMRSRPPIDPTSVVVQTASATSRAMVLFSQTPATLSDEGKLWETEPDALLPAGKAPSRRALSGV